MKISDLEGKLVQLRGKEYWHQKIRCNHCGSEVLKICSIRYIRMSSSEIITLEMTHNDGCCKKGKLDIFTIYYTDWPLSQISEREDGIFNLLGNWELTRNDL